MEEQKQRAIKPIAKNRKAWHDYHILEKLEAGIALKGTEVKSLRESKVNFKDSYAAFIHKNSDELVLIGLHISHYTFGNIENHDPLRARPILIRKREARKLRQATERQGLTIVPLQLYFSGKYVKVELGLVKGKKMYDKRAAIAERDSSRSLQRQQEE